MKSIIYGILVFSGSILVYAGGNPEHVRYPAAYQTEFTLYDTRNRVNGKQVATLYANNIATDTAGGGKLGDGAKIVMEIYKILPGEDGKPMANADGIFQKGALAAVAVMEKRSNWDANFGAHNRAGDWGFAIYNADGTPKDNKLECATCHVPMPESDYLFSYASLLEFVR